MGKCIVGGGGESWMSTYQMFFFLMVGAAVYL